LIGRIRGIERGYWSWLLGYGVFYKYDGGWGCFVGVVDRCYWGVFCYQGFAGVLNREILEKDIFLQIDDNA